MSENPKHALTAEQNLIFLRLIDVLNRRYNQMQFGLTSALHALYPIASEADASDDPHADILDTILHTLSIAASESNVLQGDVIEILYTQLMQSQSAKNAYDQGWRDRLIDLLAHATPEQSAILQAIVTGENE